MRGKRAEFPASSPFLHLFFVLFERERKARAYTAVRSTCFCAIWVCVSSSSSSPTSKPGLKF